MNKAQKKPEPARILYFENGIGYGGAIICLRHLVRNLDRTRFDPMVITGRTGPEYKEIAAEARWKHIPDRRIDTVGMKRMIGNSALIRQIPGLFFFINQLLSRLDDLGNFLPNFLQSLWTVLQFRPDLIHANNEPLCNRAAILAGKLLRIPVVCHVRGGLGPDRGESRLTRWLYGLPDHFIPVSNWISGCVGELGIRENRRTVIYDGISFEKLDVTAKGGNFRKTYGIPTDAFAVGLIGLLIPWKGQMLFLDSAQRLSQTIPNLRMLIIGGTPEEYSGYEEELKGYVANKHLNDTIQFTGHIGKMEEVYNGLDVVVSASTSPEPLGTVVIESMAMARPLIVPAHGGGAEMTDDKINALVFEPGDAASLADAIASLYADSGLRLKLGAAARAKALKTFNISHHTEGVQNIYSLLLEKQANKSVK